MIKKLDVTDGEIIKDITLYTKENVEGEYEGETGAYKLVIKTSKRTFVYEGCHEEGPSCYSIL